MRKCASGEHLKHIVCCLHFHSIEIIDAHNGLTDSCILCSQKMLVFICSFDWNRLPIAELERHDLQNGRENQNTECKCIDCAHATDYDCTCLIKCFVQATVAPPSWSVYVRNGSLFWLWQVFYNSRHASRVWWFSFISSWMLRSGGAEVSVAFCRFDANL